MQTLPWILASSAVGSLAVLIVWLQLRATRSAPSSGARAILPRLRRTGDLEQRRALCASESPARSWEARLALELTQAEGEPARLDAASELSWELSASLASRARWGEVAVRVTVALALLLAVSSVALGHRVGAVWAMLPALVGAVVAFALQAGASQAEREQRELADEFVRLLAPEAREFRETRRRRSS
jgi:hypothetical protein